MTVRSRAFLAGVLTGAGFQIAVLDVLLLHALLNWHHLVEEGNGLGLPAEPAWAWDVGWAAVGLVLVGVGIGLLPRRTAAPEARRAAFVNGALVGVGVLFALVDVVIQHWLLDLHRAHAGETAGTDLVMLALGAFLTALGAWREYAASPRSGTAPSV